ncbi:hypothetical protein [uncultured Nostoc sp.]|nr:hypothetical protein [uncultured Nostoc sp.]
MGLSIEKMNILEVERSRESEKSATLSLRSQLYDYWIMTKKVR